MIRSLPHLPLVAAIAFSVAAIISRKHRQRFAVFAALSVITIGVTVWFFMPFELSLGAGDEVSLRYVVSNSADSSLHISFNPESTAFDAEIHALMQGIRVQRVLPKTQGGIWQLISDIQIIDIMTHDRNTNKFRGSHSIRIEIDGTRTIAYIISRHTITSYDYKILDPEAFKTAFDDFVAANAIHMKEEGFNHA